MELGAPRIRYVSCDPATLARDISPPSGGWIPHRGSTLIRSLPGDVSHRIGDAAGTLTTGSMWPNDDYRCLPPLLPRRPLCRREMRNVQSEQRVVEQAPGGDAAEGRASWKRERNFLRSACDRSSALCGHFRRRAKCLRTSPGRSAGAAAAGRGDNLPHRRGGRSQPLSGRQVLDSGRSAHPLTCGETGACPVSSGRRHEAARRETSLSTEFASHPARSISAVSSSRGGS